MSYVLDGIPTAMTVLDDAVQCKPILNRATGVVTYSESAVIECPCGWRAGAELNALRFHYTHCPQAKGRCTSQMDGCRCIHIPGHDGLHHDSLVFWDDADEDRPPPSEMTTSTVHYTAEEMSEKHVKGKVGTEGEDG